MEEVRDMMLVDPADLLHYLQLGEGTTVDRQYWLAEMITAISAVEARRHRQVIPLATSGNVRTRAAAGLDITTTSNLAKRARM